MDEVRLYEMYLNEAIEERKTDLINRNEEYKNLREKFNDIMNKYPNLQFILEDRELILNETECKMLQKLSTNFVMGYTFNLCKKSISIIRCNKI